MNCAECEHQLVAEAEASPATVTYMKCMKFVPRGAANNPRITIDLSVKSGVTYTVENADQRDAYRLLQGCWLAAGEMFQLLSQSQPYK